MATVWTEVYNEEMFGVKQENKPQKTLLKAKTAPKIDVSISERNNNNQGWHITCECFNCGYRYEIFNSSDVTLNTLEDVYVHKYVCPSCDFISENNAGQRIVDDRYRFHGVTVIKTHDGKALKIVNNSILGTEQKEIYNDIPIFSHDKKSVTIDRNRDNAFISIWGNDLKKKKSRPSIDELLDDDLPYDDDDSEHGA